MFLPLVILFYNKGYLSANRYLAGFLFFSALYLLENFYFFYGKSLFRIAFFTTTHAFFYLIGPCVFFYLRSILKDNSKLDKIDYLHFALFAISLVGYVPYFFSSWDYKLTIAQNIYSENWDMAAFHINKIIPHKVDQGLNVLHTYCYAIGLWYLLWHHKKVANNPIVATSQYRLIRNWLYIFTGLVTIITLNFTVAMSNMWLYDDKSIFLNKASVALLCAAIIYVGMNMTVLFFPHIMYGLPFDHNIKLANKAIPSRPDSNSKDSLEEYPSAASFHKPSSGKAEPQLFSDEYISNIEQLLLQSIAKQTYLKPNCNLSNISDEIDIPAHHLTYYFNNIKKESFSNWRNQLRVAYVVRNLDDGKSNQLTIEAVGEQVGFKSYSTFIRSFKKVTGKTPSDYMERIS
jgi:AraC-like DNA-binding protein